MKNELRRSLTRLYREAFQKAKKPEKGHLSSPVLVNGIPKSGTNLLKNIVMALPNAQYASLRIPKSNMYGLPEGLDLVRMRITDLRAGRVYAGHYTYSPELADWLCKQGIKQVFLFRDPRDLVVSTYHYIMNRKPKHPHYDLYESLGNDSERLLRCIYGIGEGQTSNVFSTTSIPNIRLIFEAFENWLIDENTFALRYEDLVEPRQNGKDVVRKILNFLGVSFDEQFLDGILVHGKDPGKSVTFRRGGSGGWTEEFTQTHIDAFQSVAGDLLERWGYTRD